MHVSTKGAPGGQENRAIEGTNAARTHAVGALHAHAVARHVDSELCAVVAASRRLVVPIIHSIWVEVGDTIGHLHAAERIAIHLKQPVRKKKQDDHMKSLFIHMCMVCKGGFIHMYECICIFAYIYICLHLIYVNIYIYIYIHIYIHIYM